MMTEPEFEKKSCLRCENYEGVQVDQGVCHRFPPTPVITVSQLGQPQVQFYFSMVNPKNYCAEFVHKGIVATA